MLAAPPCRSGTVEHRRSRLPARRVALPPGLSHPCRTIGSGGASVHRKSGAMRKAAISAHQNFFRLYTAGSGHGKVENYPALKSAWPGRQPFLCHGLAGGPRPGLQAHRGAAGVTGGEYRLPPARRRDGSLTAYRQMVWTSSFSCLPNSACSATAQRRQGTPRLERPHRQWLCMAFWRAATV